MRFDGVLLGQITKDGFDAAQSLATLVGQSKFAEHAQLIMLDGITMGGFNVVDVFELNRQLNLPILIVCRKQPNFEKIKQALLEYIEDGKAKWAIIEKLGPMKPVGPLYVQSIGMSWESIVKVIERFSIHGNLPEPIRTAHLIASALKGGVSSKRP